MKQKCKEKEAISERIGRCRNTNVKKEFQKEQMEEKQEPKKNLEKNLFGL